MGEGGTSHCNYIQFADKIFEKFMFSLSSFLSLFMSPTLNFPLFNQVSNVVVNEVDFNPEFISRMIPKVEWTALLQAAEQVGFCTK